MHPGLTMSKLLKTLLDDGTQFPIRTTHPGCIVVDNKHSFVADFRHSYAGCTETARELAAAFVEQLNADYELHAQAVATAAITASK